MTLLVLYVTLALGVSFLCSILEAVLLSITPAFMAITQQENPSLHKRLKPLKDDVDRPLAAILSLNTIAHTIGAAGAGAQAAVVFGSNSLGIFSAVLTLLILVLSEIIPKTLGAVYWRQLTAVVSRLLPMLIWLLWPLVALSKVLTNIISGGKKGHTLSRRDIAALATAGNAAGLFDKGESRILSNLFRLRGVQAQNVMTPRTVMFMLQQDRTVGDVVEEYKSINFTRIPIYGDNTDDIRGYIHKDQLLRKAAHDEHSDVLHSFRRNLHLIPGDMKLLDLFEQLAADREHIALVEDNYGGVVGLVTLEDVIETLLGLEIMDEFDAVEDMQEWARKLREKRQKNSGLVPIAKPKTE